MQSPLTGPSQQEQQSSHPITPSQNERVMAVLAHLCVLLPQLGLVVPLVLWLANRGSAPFAAYQAKQAFFFQLAVAVLFWVVAIGGTVLGILTLGLGFLALFPLLAGWHLAADIYGIVGAVKAFEGRDFRYFLLGGLTPD